MKELGAYFYPQTTRCPTRAARAASFGRTVADETLLATQATPLFSGHRQPRTYCLGTSDTTRWDDSDVDSLLRQVELAQEYGVDFFIFDTYVGTKRGKPVHEMTTPIENFSRLDQSRRTKFASMMIMGGPRAILPVPLGQGLSEDRYYDVNAETARAMIDFVMPLTESDHYFRINGMPYLSVFTSHLHPDGSLVQKNEMEMLFGTLLDYSRQKYGTDLYLVGVAARKVAAAQQFISAGASAVTGYAFLPEFDLESTPLQDYQRLLANREQDWNTIASQGIPFVPPAVVGWDASPRGEQNYTLAEVADNYPYTPIVVNTSPTNFLDMLERAGRYLDSHVAPSEQYDIVFSWNEITEGAALLPEIDDQTIDLRYLQAIKDYKRGQK